MSVKKVPVKQAKNRHKKTRTSWPRGVSGNVHGRPRSGLALSEIFGTYLDAPVGANDTRSRKEALCAKLFSMATSKAGNVPAAKVLIEAISGAELHARLDAVERRVNELMAGGPHAAAS